MGASGAATIAVVNAFSKKEEKQKNQTKNEANEMLIKSLVDKERKLAEKDRIISQQAQTILEKDYIISQQTQQNKNLESEKDLYLAELIDNLDKLPLEKIKKIMSKQLIDGNQNAFNPAPENLGRVEALKSLQHQT